MRLLHYELHIICMLLLICSVVQEEEEEEDFPVPRIWNGKPAKLGQFPYQIGLMRKLRPFSKGIYGTFCGGAIIKSNKVLTAAHCLVPDDNRTLANKCACKPKPVASQEEIDSFRIVAGNIRSILNLHKPRDNTSQYAQWRKIDDYNYLKKYNFPQQDICLITTDMPFKFNKYVNRLPYASKSIDYGSKMCTASGFGILNKNPNKPKFSTRMMWEQFKLLPKADCKKKHKNDMKDFICTENSKKDVTQGDSGGPLVCKSTGDPREGKKGIIVGVVCGESKYGNYFTRVSSYTQFVDSAQKISSPKFSVIIGLAIIFFNKK